MNHSRRTDADMQMAADLQMAYDMQAAEAESRLLQAHQSHQTSIPSRQRQAESSTPFSSLGGIPIVQGRSIRQPRLASSGAQSAINSDGLSTQNQSLIFVPAEINERLVEMMVDTGAQSSVISTQLMRTLGLQSKLNTRMQGTAQGVGQARILGVIENCPVQIGHVEFLLYFLVLDVPQDMIILGIDQMRRFKCQIDLENDKLVFGGKDGVEVSFLPQEPKFSGRRAMSGGCPVS